jgi:hypothetical protein
MTNPEDVGNKDKETAPIDDSSPLTMGAMKKFMESMLKDA